MPSAPTERHDLDTPTTSPTDAAAAQEFREVIDTSRRESILRDLYAIAAFYTAHPDHPLPSYITLGHYVPLDVLEATAATYAGGRVYGDERAQCHHELAETKIQTTMMIVSPHPDRDERPL